MKLRYGSVAFLLCGVFALSSSSPAGKKDLINSGKSELLEKKINPSISEAEGTDDSDDLLARAKKSSTTTFCVEIKPGNDQPAVVVCDPSKSDQVPIPSQAHPPPPPPPAPAPAPAPAPQPEGTIYYNPPSIGDLIPDYPRELQPSLGYDPVIVIPQQPQILPQIYQQPQILQPFSQPQVILVRDPSCPSSNPSIVSSFLQPGRLFASRSFEYPMDAASLWRSAYSPEEEALKSVPGMNTLSGMWATGYTNPLAVIGNQQSDLMNVRTLAQGSPLITGHLSPEAQLNRQFLIQCNPSITPIAQNQYAVAPPTGKANDQDSRSMNMGGLGSGHPSQFMYPSTSPGFHGSHMNHESMHYNKGLPMHNGHHYQSNMYPYNKPYNMHHKMTMSDADAKNRAAEESQVGVKGEQKMPEQQGQSMTDSFTKIVSGQQLGGQNQPNPQSFDHGASLSGGEGRALNGQKEQKMGSEASMGGSQGSDSRYYSSSLDQGQNQGFGNQDRSQMTVNGKDQDPQHQIRFSHSQQQQSSFVGGNGMQSSFDSKDQGFPKQMGFPQNQQQQKMIQKDPLTGRPRPKAIDDMPAYSQMLMQRMKSAVAQHNLVQPFMVSSSDLPGDKSTQSKV